MSFWLLTDPSKHLPPLVNPSYIYDSISTLSVYAAVASWTMRNKKRTQIIKMVPFFPTDARSSTVPRSYWHSRLDPDNVPTIPQTAECLRLSTNNTQRLWCSVCSSISTEMQTSLSPAFYGQVILHSKYRVCAATDYRQKEMKYTGLFSAGFLNKMSIRQTWLWRSCRTRLTRWV